MREENTRPENDLANPQEKNLELFLGMKISLNIYPFYFILIFLALIFISNSSTIYSQDLSQPYNFTGNPQYTNYMANSTAFKQEIARLEINVDRQGKGQLPIAQVPRLQKNDVLKVRLLEEAVNGIKPDQSNWQWTLLIAYVNPGLNGEADKSISEEIQFKKTGWYKEYSFVVPYDNQPIFFLYPKPNYRDKILNLINKNKDEIRKIGEKTIEIANAYAKIGSFLNELQFVLNRSAYGYNGYSTNSYSGVYGTDPYGSYDPYSSTGATTTSTFNKSLFMEQSIERIARSFNIQMPSCWQNGSYYGSSSNYGSPYNNNVYNNYSTNYSNNLMGNDLISRTQCLAKSVRIEDLDFSIGKMLQQGGILLAQQLSQKYPQIAYWINIAAVAIDFILKVTQKTPLKLVPTVITTNVGQNTMATTSTSPYSNSLVPGSEVYQTNPAYQTNPNYQTNQTGGQNNEQSKISLFAEVSPMSDGFVTAYPIVVHKWQANPDPEVIKLPTPVLMDSCMHIGSNILSSTDVINDWMSDSFTKDFQLVISSPNGFRKAFPLKKNVGLNGWDLFLSKEDLDSFPKINMPLNSVVVGKRGFNEISSPIFRLPSPSVGSWEINQKSKDLFAVGSVRKITMQNSMNNCRCLQAVVYKPSFGGQFVFEASNKENGLIYSEDGKEVSFVVDATTFQSDDGILELKQFGGESSVLEIKLHPSLPSIDEFNVSKGDKRFVISGDGIDQISSIIINGDRAIAVNNPNESKNSSEREFHFENPKTQILSSNVSLELELKDARIYPYPKKFNVSLARPIIISNNTKEVKGVVVSNSQGVYKTTNSVNPQNLDSSQPKTKSVAVSEKLPDFPVGSSEVTINLKNALTDYDFKPENISIETRIADFPNKSFEVELPKANFNVLDWNHIQVSFLITKPFMDILGNGKLQFRIRDKARGDSDWYTVRNSARGEDDPAITRFTNKSNPNVNKESEKTMVVEQVKIATQTSDSLMNKLSFGLQGASDNNIQPVTNVTDEKSGETESVVEKSKALMPNQTVAQAYTATALEYYVKKDYKTAYDWFNKAVIADPSNPLYHYNLGAVLTALRSFEAAEREMSEATRLDPENQTFKIGLDAAQQNSKQIPN